MRAVVVHAAKDLRIDELPTPVAGPGEVAVRVVYGGICGSDLHYYGQGRNGAFVVNEPMILGHEVVGVIEATGDGVAADVVVGGSVAIHPARPPRRRAVLRAGATTCCRGATSAAPRRRHTRRGHS